MEALKLELFGKGGIEEDWNAILMGVGKLMEYDCVDSHWRPQGKAVVELVEFEDDSKGLVRAIHLLASDGYYQHYAEERLGVDACVHHLCRGKNKNCKERLPRTDRRVGSRG